MYTRWSTECRGKSSPDGLAVPIARRRAPARPRGSPAHGTAPPAQGPPHQHMHQAPPVLASMRQAAAAAATGQRYRPLCCCCCCCCCYDYHCGHSHCPCGQLCVFAQNRSPRRRFRRPLESLGLSAAVRCPRRTTPTSRRRPQNEHQVQVSRVERVRARPTCPVK